MTEQAQEMLTLSRKLYDFGYRRQWAVGDELWYERKRRPGRFQIEYIFRSRASGYLFIRGSGKILRVGLSDDRLIHLPKSEDVLDWFKAQKWIDFYVLRTEGDATYEFTFYYHRRSAFKSFHHSDERFVSLQAMVAAYELMLEIIAD